MQVVDIPQRTSVVFACKTRACSCVAGSKESLLSATISANEEAMSILEEVIMYTFQQCVYYITKVCTDVCKCMEWVCCQIRDK